MLKQLEETLGAVSLVTLNKIDELEPLLLPAIQAGLERVIVLGGDGTNHYLINVLMRLRAEKTRLALPAFGVLPCGTGSDWARGLRMPLQWRRALIWLSQARPKPIDIGELRDQRHRRYFLNIASCGLAGEVSHRASRLKRKRSWSYFFLTLQSLVNFEPPVLSIEVDGKEWYEGPTALLVCANGSVFGRGMQIAPGALLDDGLLHIVLAHRLNLLELLRLAPSAYWGAKQSERNLKMTSGQRIVVRSRHPFRYEMDGEPAVDNQLSICLHESALNALLA